MHSLTGMGWKGVLGAERLESMLNLSSPLLFSPGFWVKAPRFSRGSHLSAEVFCANVVFSQLT